MDKLLLTPEETAEVLGICRSKVYELSRTRPCTCTGSSIARWPSPCAGSMCPATLRRWWSRPACRTTSSQRSPRSRPKRSSGRSERRLEALYLVAITTGMREGELLGLRWGDVDLTTRSIRVRRSRARHQGVAGETKTPESRRQVAVPELAVRALVAHQARQAAERQRRGMIWDDLDLVFPNTIGRPISPQNPLRRDLTRYWRLPGCHGSASTTCGIRWPCCCSAEGCTPGSSVRCSGTPTLASRLTCTRTSPLPCSTTRPGTSTRYLVVNLVVRSAAQKTKPQISPRSSGDRATVS
jgi:hypothetical protein